MENEPQNALVPRQKREIVKISVAKSEQATVNSCKTQKKSSKFKNFWNKIKYAVVPFIIFVAVLVVTFYGNQVIYWLRGGGYATQYHKIAIDDSIPLIPWFIYFYFLTFPCGIFAFFYVAYHDRKTLSDIFYTLIISFAISGIIYFFFQTYLTKPDFTPTDFTGSLLAWTWGATNPINNFPSQHAFMAFAMILGCLFMKGDKKTWWVRALMIVISILVIMSTFFTKQHYFIDWVGSFCIMIPIFFIVRAVRHRKEKKNPNFVPLQRYENWWKRK